MKPTNDQKRVETTLVPLIRHAAASLEDQGKLDCTLLVRQLIQGPDPLYLAQTCPQLFEMMCKMLIVDPAHAMAKIQLAHEQGPGALIVRGSDFRPEIIESGHGFGPDEAPEVIWLLLANCCHDEGSYDKALSLQQRQAATNEAVIAFAKIASYGSAAAMINVAAKILKGIEACVALIPDKDGIPHTDHNMGYYLAYKQGHTVCAVHTKDKIYWGTAPGVTLADRNIPVDKLIKPSFGFTFLEK